MYAKKVIECSFTLTPQECYMFGDTKELAKYIFLKQYKNKCIARCYVLDVIDVMRVSPIMIMESDLEGRAKFSTVVLVEALIYEKGMILPSTLISITNGNLILESDHASINCPYIANDIYITSIPLKSIVPIMIQSVNYNTIYSSKDNKTINCMGSIYNPKKDINPYKNIAINHVFELTDDDIKYLTIIKNYYEKIIDNIKINDPKILAKIHDSFYPFKKRVNKYLDPLVNIIDIKNLLDFKKFPTYTNSQSKEKVDKDTENAKSAYVSMPYFIPNHIPEYAIIELKKNISEEDDKFIIKVDMEAKDFIEYAITNYFTYMIGTIELSNSYTQSSYSQVSTLWKYYDTIKL